MHGLPLFFSNSKHHCVCLSFLFSLARPPPAHSIDGFNVDWEVPGQWASDPECHDTLAFLTAFGSRLAAASPPIGVRTIGVVLLLEHSYRVVFFTLFLAIPIQQVLNSL